MSNTNLFDRLVAETANLSSTPIPVFSTGHLKRWTDLADFWKAHHSTFANLFYEAIFHIARNRYSKATTALKPLLRLIEEVLLTDSDALAMWRKHPSFKIALMTVLNGIDDGHRWKSPAMQSFISAKLQVLLLYREKPMPELTLATARNRRTYRSVCYQLETQATYSRFVELIQLLVPNSCNWSQHQWSSESFIFSQIQTIHGIDFSTHLNDFGALVHLYKNRAESLPYYRPLFLIKNLPASIARLIWPVGMEKELCKQFHIFCNVRPIRHSHKIPYHNPLTLDKIANSWAFQQLESCRKNGTYPLSDKTRSRMLHIALGEHPWNIKHGLPTVA